MLFLRPLVGQERAAACKIRVALDILGDIEVHKAIKFRFDVAHVFPQPRDRLSSRPTGCPLVRFHSFLKIPHPFARKHKHRKKVGKIGGELLFADIGLRTASCRFFGTAIVDVAVSVSVLLVFLSHFGRYCHTTLATGHEAAEYLRLDLRDLGMRAFREDVLHLVIEKLFDDWYMTTFVQFAAIEKMPVVKGVGEDEADAVAVDAVAVRATDSVVV